MDLTFPTDFIWGASTSAYQIEGAASDDGKGASVWDTFSHTQGKIRGGDNGDNACNHYYRYQDDVLLMKNLGLNAYRFSTAWTRFFSEGKGKPNLKGRDFYNRLIDNLLENNIEPWLCLYHWDLPQVLQDKGGWANRDTAYYFTDYVSYVAAQYGDRVKHFITLNEPNVHALVGHLLGIHAPGLSDMSVYAQSVHHLNLASGMALEQLRSQHAAWKLGTVLSLQPVHAHTDKDADQEAKELFDAVWNRSVLDPLLKGRYPKLMMGMLEDIVQAGDLGQIQQPIDFLGVNFYSRVIVQADPKSPVGLRQSDPPKSAERTDMGWEIYPDGLTEQLLELKNDYGNPKVFITENGAAFNDDLDENGVNDHQRISYLEKHLQAVYEARQKGANVGGYFVWSLLDNFEWAEGFEKRFGLVYTDYATQKRIPKASYRWYQDVIRNGGFNFVNLE
jgi:beta-glucosidase